MSRDLLHLEQGSILGLQFATWKLKTFVEGKTSPTFGDAHANTELLQSLHLLKQFYIGSKQARLSASPCSTRNERFPVCLTHPFYLTPNQNQTTALDQQTQLVHKTKQRTLLNGSVLDKVRKKSMFRQLRL